MQLSAIIWKLEWVLLNTFIGIDNSKLSLVWSDTPARRSNWELNTSFVFIRVRESLAHCRWLVFEFRTPRPHEWNRTCCLCSVPMAADIYSENISAWRYVSCLLLRYANAALHSWRQVYNTPDERASAFYMNWTVPFQLLSSDIFLHGCSYAHLLCELWMRRHIRFVLNP